MSDEFTGPCRKCKRTADDSAPWGWHPETGRVCPTCNAFISGILSGRIVPGSQTPPWAACTHPGCLARPDGRHPDNHPVCPECGSEKMRHVYYTGPLMFVCVCGHEFDGQPIAVRTTRS